jgi:hypothetical protein
MRKQFWLEYLKKTDHSENLDVDGSIVKLLKLALGKQDFGLWVGFMWLTI